MRRAWLPAVAGLMLAFAAGCQSAADKPDNDAMAAEQQIKTVKVAQVTKQIISEPEEVVANVVPSVQMDIILKADGDVRELVKKRGDTVAKDEVILRIDDKDARSQKEKADLAVRNAEIQLKKTREDIENGRAEMKSAMDKLQRQLDDMQRQYNKLLNDYDAGLVNKQQLEQAELNLANMKQDLDVLKMKYDALLNSDAVEAAELALQTARLNAEDAAKALGYYDVKAPVGGVLTELVPEVGMTVGRGFRAGQIVQLDPVKIQAGLTAAQRAKVEGKSELAFRISGSTEWMTGKIRYLADVVNSQTNAYDLELEVPNKDTLLKPGMKVQVRLTSEQEQQVVAVPMTSIVREGMETYVFVLNNDIAEKRKVELGRLKDTYQEVLSGLKEGETLIVSGHQQLNDKEKVQVAR
jgi:RND family efflux transporter MFP subunit